MNGAGVYLMGLWAYLGARRTLTLTVSEAGGNVEPHRVKVRGREWVASDHLRRVTGDTAALGCGLTVPHVDAGTVDTSGALSLAGQRQRAVYYRQTRMRGAGVYRLGLWAYLGARRGHPLMVPEAGRGVLPHRVRVRGQTRVGPEVWQKMGSDWADLALGLYITLDVNAGSVNTSGKLKLAGQLQRAVYYRQTCMRGAGVYQAGLWAMLAPRPVADAQAESGAALGGSQPGAVTARYRPMKRLSLAERVSPLNALKRMRAAFDVVQVVKKVARPPLQAGLELLNRSEMRRTLTDAFRGQGVEPGFDFRKLAGWMASGVHEQIHAALNVQAGQLEERAERRAFRQAAREVLRLLRRMLPRRVPQRPPMRAPRPLYSRAVPPAAPLAPPAL